MEKTWEIVKLLAQKSVVALLSGLVAVAGKVVDYLQGRREDKAREKAEAEAEKAEKKLKDACEKGDVKDLIDAAEGVGKAKGRK